MMKIKQLEFVENQQTVKGSQSWSSTDKDLGYYISKSMRGKTIFYASLNGQSLGAALVSYDDAILLCQNHFESVVKFFVEKYVVI